MGIDEYINYYRLNSSAGEKLEPEREFVRKPKLAPRGNTKRSLQELLPILKGQTKTRLPRAYWERGFVFSNFSDKVWKELTVFFPTGRQRKTHPLYILQEDALGTTVCPCSSKNWLNSPYIPEGAELAYTGLIMDRNSYVLTTYRCELRPECAYDANPLFLGSFPFEDLVEE